MENMPEFTLHRPETAAEAIRLKATDATSRYLAGGTDMIVNVRRGIEAPETMIDLTAISAIAEITRDGDGMRIGAGVRLSDLAAHEDIRRDFPAVAQAAASVAGPTHRQYGTIGGNLCLDTRCLFYNQSQWWRESNNFCLKHKGDVCHVAPGGKRCFAAFSGDVAPAMLIYGASVDLVPSRSPICTVMTAWIILRWMPTNCWSRSICRNRPPDRNRPMKNPAFAAPSIFRWPAARCASTWPRARLPISVSR